MLFKVHYDCQSWDMFAGAGEKNLKTHECKFCAKFNLLWIELHVFSLYNLY